MLHITTKNQYHFVPCPTRYNNIGDDQDVKDIFNLIQCQYYSKFILLHMLTLTYNNNVNNVNLLFND